MKKEKQTEVSTRQQRQERFMLAKPELEKVIEKHGLDAVKFVVARFTGAEKLKREAEELKRKAKEAETTYQDAISNIEKKIELKSK